MRWTIAVAVCVSLLAACTPDGADDRRTGAVANEPGPAAVTDTAAIGTAGTGTSGAQANGSGGTRAADAPSGDALPDQR